MWHHWCNSFNHWPLGPQRDLNCPRRLDNLHWMNLKLLQADCNWLLWTPVGKYKSIVSHKYIVVLFVFFAIIFLSASFYPAHIGLKVFFLYPIFFFFFCIIYFFKAWRNKSFIKFLMLSTSPVVNTGSESWHDLNKNEYKFYLSHFKRNIVWGYKLIHVNYSGSFIYIYFVRPKTNVISM